jgi:hypothetical protein
MLTFAAAALAVALAPSPSPSPLPSPGPVPAELASTFTTLITRTDAFATKPDRAFDALVAGLTAPAPGDWLWVVEFRWKEKEAPRTGVALIVDVPKLAAADPRAGREIKVREGQWGVATVLEDKTFAGWLEDMRKARLAANEAAALGNLRTLISAQFAFQATAGNGKFAGELACLSAPASCVPSYTGGHFLPPELAVATERSGYRHAFHPGKRGVGADGKPSRLVENWAATAVPIDATHGRRAFCANQTGVLCAVESGTMSAITAGACPSACKVVH